MSGFLHVGRHVNMCGLVFSRDNWSLSGLLERLLLSDHLGDSRMSSVLPLQSALPAGTDPALSPPLTLFVFWA